MFQKKEILFCFLAFGFIYGQLYSQTYYLTKKSFTDFFAEKNLYICNCFPSFRPHKLYADSLQKIDSLFFVSTKTKDKKHNLWLRVEPNFFAGLQNQNKFVPLTSVDFSVLYSYKKFNLQIEPSLGLQKPLKSDNWFLKNNILPEKGIVHKTGDSLFYYYIPRFRANYNFSKYLFLETGFNKHFYGDGNRSMLLSDNHFPYPYVKFGAELWRIKYEILYSWQKDFHTKKVSRFQDGITRFNATHYLSWNVSNSIKLSFFEAVIAPLNDTQMPRQLMEYNYLLPVVFFRPLDFALGSTDNVLLGGNLSFTLFKKHIFYAQFLFDELFMNEYRADLLQMLKPDSARNYGAWVNKHAYQFGYKNYDFILKNLFLRAELNIARPYTYSHRDLSQNYAHAYQPLAHPMGANFIEQLFELKYLYKRLLLEAQYSILYTGLDSNNTHYGQDIFKVTFDARIPELNNIPVKYYHNKTKQGVPAKFLFADFSVSYEFAPEYKLNLILGLNYRETTINSQKQNYSFYYAGIRWGLNKPMVNY